MANDSEQFARQAILEEFKSGTKIDKAFLKILDFLPEKIDREEFDYWFKKFEKGEEGLEYDLEERKVRAHRAIFSRMGLEEQLLMYKAGGRPREILKTMRFNFEKCHVSIAADCIYVKFNDYPLNVYWETPEDAEKRDLKIQNFREMNWKTPRKNMENFGNLKFVKIPKNEKFLDQAVNDIMFALKNPKNSMKSLSICVKGYDLRTRYKETCIYTFLEKFRTELGKVAHKVSIKSLTLQDNRAERIHAILGCLKPGFLENITIAHPNFSSWKFPNSHEMRRAESPIDSMVQSEQWKKAKRICWFYGPLDIQMDYFYHLQNFEILVDNMPMEEFKYLLRALRRNANFKNAIIQCQEPIDFENETEELGVFQNPSDFADDQFHLRIPHSTDLITMRIGHDAIFIVRNTSPRNNR
ncbi:hypothetical protein L5515_009572 [Caenorhabditis briggsae]|uniref:DUF38 domain-containing protein n=1 Tax=Caenorhabditis briggsae TaxID=6238 RepID=A0AAE9FA71_CAEBR|nr:hypothetical protein L5515_009572 [Caenorhabditis briggsae]